MYWGWREVQNPEFASRQRGQPSQYRPPEPCDSRVSCSGSVVTLLGGPLRRTLPPPPKGMSPAGSNDDHHFIPQQTSLANWLGTRSLLSAILHPEHNTRFRQDSLTMRDHWSGNAGFPPNSSMLRVFHQGISIQQRRGGAAGLLLTPETPRPPRSLRLNRPPADTCSFPTPETISYHNASRSSPGPTPNQDPNPKPGRMSGNVRFCPADRNFRHPNK